MNKPSNTAIDSDVIDRISDFAKSCVATRSDLHTQKNFPPDLWRAMATRDLLGLVIPKAYGGLGSNYATMARCATILAEQGGSLGVVMTWMGHNLNAALHLGNYGTAEQKQFWLPRVAAGDSSMTVAISEPGAGAHPKLLTTSAVRDGDEYILNGEKSYLTNGPLADVFLVLAVTGEEDSRKSFSGFLIPRDTPGYEQTPGIPIDFLHPATHCGIKLNNCRVPTSQMIGDPGKAFDQISLSMRAVEDALFTASSVGGLRWMLNHVAGLAQLSDQPREAIMALGALANQADLLAQMAIVIGEGLDLNRGNPQDLMPLNAGFRSILQTLRHGLDDMVETYSLEPGVAYQAVHRDIVKMSGLAARAYEVAALKRGQSLMVANHKHSE